MRVPIPDDLEEPPAEPTVNPPIHAAVNELPSGEIPWTEFEKLCVRLIKRESDVEHAQRFGTAGQDQSGIDIYARRAEATYVAYQCRRVERLTAGDLRSAVSDFIGGAWADRASTFVFCTSRSMVRTELAEELEAQAALLRAHDPPIGFELWGSEELSEKLKNHGDLVRDYFGTGWLSAFLPDYTVAEVASEVALLREAVEGLARSTVYVFDWDPEQARRELAALAQSNADLFERLEARIGNPPEGERVSRVVSEGPKWLVDARESTAWRVLGMLAENAGEWPAAATAWLAAADLAEGNARAGLLVAAAVAANVGGDTERHDELLALAAELAPTHPRVLLQKLDQTAGGKERLAFLEGVESDDAPVAALIASHRALASLLLPDVAAAREFLAEAQISNPRSATVRMVGVNVTVQQGRLDVLGHRPINYPALTGAHADALELIEQLRRERRYDESVRCLMLAGDSLILMHESKAALALLRSANAEELATDDAAEVLGDVGIRAFGWHQVLELTADAPPTDGVRRIRACACAEVGSLPERRDAVVALDEIVAARGPEAPMAAVFRVGLTLGPEPVPDWSEDAAQVLRDEGFEQAALAADALLKGVRQKNHSAAYDMLGQYEGEPWAELTKLRIAAARHDKSSVVEAATALASLGPGQDVLVACGGALGRVGELDQAARILAGVAHDQSCPPAIRADAFSMLVPLLADQGEWSAAKQFFVEWLDIRPSDARLSPWAPTIANRAR